MSNNFDEGGVLGSYLPQWLQDLETILSLVAFGITVFVYKSISDIKLSYQRRTRLPEITKDLSSYASSLSKALSSSDLISARTEIVSARLLIKKAIKITPSGSKKDLLLIIERLDMSKPMNRISERNMDSMWEIYSELHTAIRMIDQSIKDAKWE